ncbi:MAG: hypothetical protein U9Q81_20145 [Pseudomonadota bacterium]|nr:hypothetical protein [Pseudomonadota bacterium]
MRKLMFTLVLLVSGQLWAGVPATPVMTLYQFNGAQDVPYYEIESFRKRGASSPAGTLTQGTSLIPCLVVRNGKPLTDRSGTPFVGFQVVVDSRKASRASTDKFKKTFAKRRSMSVPNHHCDGSVRHVIDVRRMFTKNKAPFFDPPRSAKAGRAGGQGEGDLDRIVRAFHNSADCENANRTLVGRRQALERSWKRFIGANKGRWSEKTLAKAKHLDYTMRTALFEGHLDRGCNAYGACERNVIALSIRNRARESCSGRQGCRFPGDFQGVSSKVSQYNIWDEYLTQISGLTSCFLRDDLGGSGDYYGKLQRMYAQNVADVQLLLFGDDQDLRSVFPRNGMSDLKSLRHYYHAPAMGKCLPNHKRVEYMSGAVARKGNDFALIANTRIRVDKRSGEGYLFRDVELEEAPDRDVVEIVNNYPGFVVDGRKVDLKASSGCPPYGIPRGCGFKEVGRYRKTPFWLKAGKPLELVCSVKDRGESCQGTGRAKTAKVGGVCDTQMRPVAGVR